MVLGRTSDGLCTPDAPIWSSGGARRAVEGAGRALLEVDGPWASYTPAVSSEQDTRQPPWHRRAGWLAIVLSVLAWAALGLAVLVALGETRGMSAEEIASRWLVLRMGMALSIAMFGAATWLAIRAREHQFLASGVGLLFGGLGLVVSLGVVALAFAY